MAKWCIIKGMTMNDISTGKTHVNFAISGKSSRLREFSSQLETFLEGFNDLNITSMNVNYYRDTETTEGKKKN